MAACGAAAGCAFATAAQLRAIPHPGRAASVAGPRDAAASGTGGRAPVPFWRRKAHPRDRKGHARLVAHGTLCVGSAFRLLKADLRLALCLLPRVLSDEREAEFRAVLYKITVCYGERAQTNPPFWIIL